MTRAWLGAFGVGLMFGALLSHGIVSTGACLVVGIGLATFGLTSGSKSDG